MNPAPKYFWMYFLIITVFMPKFSLGQKPVIGIKAGLAFSNATIYQGSAKPSKLKTSTRAGAGLPYSYQVCNAVGTFDLTLVNKNNQTIKITNGVVNQSIQF